MSDSNKSVCEKANFEHIFNTYFSVISNYIYYKCGNLEIAEDVVQDTFITLWERCDTIEFAKAKAFLYKVANNKFLDVVKHKKVVLNHAKFFDNTTTNQSPEFLLIEAEFAEKLKYTIASLPEKQREVFLLNRIDKKKYREIAELLNISIKAVEKRMSLALIVLRKEIGNI